MSGGLSTFTALSTPTATQLNTLVNPSVYKLSDQVVVSSIVFVNDSELFFTAAANAVYIMAIEGQYTAAVAGGLRIQFTLPAGATYTNASVLSPVSGTVQYQNTSTGGAITNLVPANTSNTPFRLAGTLIMSSTPGAVNFQWAQSASSATGTVMKAGAFLMAIRIA